MGTVCKAILLLFVLATPAGAAIVTNPPPSFSGPGGSGKANIANDDTLSFFAAIGNLQSLDLTFAVDSPGTYTMEGALQNLDNVTWSAYTFDILSAGAAFTDAVDFSGHFADTLPDLATPQTSFVFRSGSVEEEDSFSPIVKIQVTDAGTITIRQSAVTDTLSVPEPSTLVMGLTGLGLVILRWRTYAALRCSIRASTLIW
jgi:hypothetical protein